MTEGKGERMTEGKGERMTGRKGEGMTGRKGEGMTGVGPSSQILLEPRHDALLDVALVVGLRDRVAFVLVDDELRGHRQGLQGVPELVALRRGDFRVPVAVQDECRGLRLLDELDRGG